MHPEALAAAVLASPEALWMVADALRTVRVARWIVERDGRALEQPGGRRLAWVTHTSCWWDAGKHSTTGVAIEPSRWRGRSQDEPCASVAEGVAHINRLFRAAGWVITLKSEED